MNRRDDLFPRQRELLHEIRAFISERGIPPTFRELAAALGVKSPSGIRQQLRALERKGYLKLEPGAKRGIILVESEEPNSVPIVGQVVAGNPVEASELHDGRLALGASIGITEKQCFAVRVEGESMIEDHIVEGDYVVLDPRIEPKSGHVVAVQVDGAVTLKRYRRTAKGAELVPAHKSMKPIIIEDGVVHSARVIGVAVALVRRMGGFIR
jgi:repressor LexA